MIDSDKDIVGSVEEATEGVTQVQVTKKPTSYKNHFQQNPHNSKNLPFTIRKEQ